MDELAEELGMDPMELRLKNAVKEGDRMPNGVAHSVFGCVELEEAMKNHPHYTAPLGGPNRGRGVAVAFRAQGGQTSSATINVNGNGNYQHNHRVGGHRGNPHGHCHAGRRSAGSGRRGCFPLRGRHR